MRPSNIALVVRDEALYGPLILAVAREYGLEVAAYYAVPLENTRVGSFVGALDRHDEGCVRLRSDDEVLSAPAYRQARLGALGADTWGASSAPRGLGVH